MAERKFRMPGLAKAIRDHLAMSEDILPDDFEFKTVE